MRITRFVDLSVPVGAGTVVYPGDPEPRLTVHSTVERDGFNLLSVSMGSQSGTHVDAPYHFDEDTPRIDELPLARFFGPAVVVDATGAGPRGRITWDEHVAPIADRLAPGVIVLLRTDWSEHYGTATYFENPFLDADAARRILEAGVRTICIDAINIDETPDDDHPGEGFPVHHLIAEAGGVIGENFRNVGAIDWPDPVVSCFPIALEAADGAPVRAVALQVADGVSG
ncbi:MULTISPECIES: cyclase family protein [unclassified Nocardioides]|uniref:cyclase family protein n=1 Tax=unclassified Nocardioides TaxID=2615069 RepID=UPI000A269659|nr:MULTISPECIES: cyclase family protein [unclassified Nocardioides]